MHASLFYRFIFFAVFLPIISGSMGEEHIEESGELSNSVNNTANLLRNFPISNAVPPTLPNSNLIVTDPVFETSAVADNYILLFFAIIIGFVLMAIINAFFPTHAL